MKTFITIPNILTISRICLLPFFAIGFFITSKFGILLSLIVFSFCCITDYLDGYYARAFKQSTKLGQILDPLADKILIAISILFVMGFELINRISIIPASIILCREIIISSVRDGVIKYHKDFKTSKFSKWKTLTQMVSIAIILFSTVINSIFWNELGEIILWISSIITLISGIIYCKNYFIHTDDLLK
jgi:cardiolipin synthase